MMNVLIVTFLVITLLIYVINIVFQISAMIPYGPLTESIFEDRTLFETIDSMQIDYIIPFWCYYINIIIYLLTLLWIVICATTKHVNKIKNLIFLPILFHNLSIICDNCWIIYFIRFGILEMNICSTFQFIFQLIACCLLGCLIRKISFCNVCSFYDFI